MRRNPQAVNFGTRKLIDFLLTFISLLQNYVALLSTEQYTWHLVAKNVCYTMHKTTTTIQTGL